MAAVKGAILARVSQESDKRAKNERGRGSSRSKSVSEQLDLGRLAAAALGWDVPASREFTDDGISASSFATKERPGWLELRRYIESGFVNGVIIWAVNRASREVEDWSGFLNLCRKNRVLIYVVSNERTYDCTNAHDLKVLIDEGVDGWFESEKRSVDVKRGVNGAKAEGLPLGPPAIGYKKVRAENGDLENYAIVEPGAAKIRTVFNMLDAGHTHVETAEAVGMVRQQVRNSARKLTYIAKRRMPDGTLVDCIWPPLIEEDQFWRVQAVLDSHPQAGRPGSHRDLLSYIATCARCDGEIAPHNRNDEGRDPERNYRCKPHGHVVIPVERADNAVMFEMLGELIQPGVLERYLPRQDVAEAAKAETEANRLKSELNEWLEAGVSAVAYKKKEDELLPKIAAAGDRARRARATVTPAGVAAEQFARALDPFTGDETTVATDARLNAAIAVWDGLPLQAARDLVRQTLRVTLHPARNVPPGLHGAYLTPKGTFRPGQVEITWRDLASEAAA